MSDYDQHTLDAVAAISALIQVFEDEIRKARGRVLTSTTQSGRNVFLNIVKKLERRRVVLTDMLHVLLEDQYVKEKAS